MGIEVSLDVGGTMDQLNPCGEKGGSGAKKEEKLTRDEKREVELHKYYLSMKAGYDVGWDLACEDWLKYYAKKYREERRRRELTDEEKNEIELHKYYLSSKAGCDVGWDFACDDWLKNHSRKWRAGIMIKDSEEEIKEMLKHKWIESEKAGKDLGDRAVFDWIEKYADKWREIRKKSVKQPNKNNG
jgi:hypothetical protein